MGFIGWTVSFLGKSMKGNKGDTVTLFYLLSHPDKVFLFSSLEFFLSLFTFIKVYKVFAAFRFCQDVTVKLKKIF